MSREFNATRNDLSSIAGASTQLGKAAIDLGGRALKGREYQSYADRAKNALPPSNQNNINSLGRSPEPKKNEMAKFNFGGKNFNTVEEVYADKTVNSDDKLTLFGELNGIKIPSAKAAKSADKIAAKKGQVLNAYGEPIQPLGPGNMYQLNGVGVLPWNGELTTEAIGTQLTREQFLDYIGQANVTYDSKGNPVRTPMRLNPELSPETQSAKIRSLDRSNIPAQRQNTYGINEMGETYAKSGPIADQQAQARQGKIDRKRSSFFDYAKSKQPNMTSQQLWQLWDNRDQGER